MVREGRHLLPGSDSLTASLSGEVCYAVAVDFGMAGVGWREIEATPPHQSYAIKLDEIAVPAELA